MGTLGKPPKDFMDRVIYRNLGAQRKEVLVGPRAGFDNAFVSIRGHEVMVVTADPVSVVPRIGMEKSAWLSVHLIASDLATSGVSPQFAAFTLNFPIGMSQHDREVYLTALGKACGDIGVAIVAGHTGTYPGASFTVVGGGTMVGFASEGEYVDPSMARSGDLILMTKGAAIEATASLAASFPGFTSSKIGKRLTRSAISMLDQCTTVTDSVAAKSVGLGDGAVTSMHDATEGGIFGALEEMSVASGKLFEVDPVRIKRSEEADKVCSAFGLNPFETMGEGALLITCSPAKVPELENTMSQKGIPLAKVGVVKNGKGLVLTGGGAKSRRHAPGPDRYWSVYKRMMERGLS